MDGSKRRRSAGRGSDRRQRGMPQRGRRLMVVLGVLIVVLAIAAVIAAMAGEISTPTGSTAFAQDENVGAADRQPIFVLGDSFAQSPYFGDQFPDAVSGREVEIDGVGGSSLDEQRQRFLGRIEGWKSLLVILDGGLTDSSAVRPVADIIAQLDTGCGRWLYVEPPHSAANGGKGSPEYRRQQELVEAVRQRWPDHFVPLIDALAQGADGSAGDRADVEAGWTPASLRQEADPAHLNAKGNHILVRTIAEAVAKFDRVPVSACSGPSMEQMQAVMNAP